MFCTTMYIFILELQPEKMILRQNIILTNLLFTDDKTKGNLRYYVRVQTMEACEVLALFTTLTIESTIVLLRCTVIF